MTLFAFIFVLISGLLTLNIYFPVFRVRRLLTPSFGFGWLGGELALQLVILQGLIGAVLVAGGSFSGLVGLIGIFALFASWAGLLHIHYQGMALGPVVEAALTKGLGANYSQAITSDLASTLQQNPDIPSLLLPFKLDKTGINITTDIDYGHHGLKLDLYRPEGDLSSAPVLMHIHGGAWMYGDKKGQALPLMHYLAKLGWVCCSVSYRLSPKASHPDHIVDCKAALAWIKANIGDYGGDPNFIAVTGGSAGGHLSSLVALTPNDPQFQPGFEGADTTVQAAVPFYGVFDWTDADQLQPSDLLKTLLEGTVVKQPLEAVPEVYSAASPLHRITPEAPPMMIIHGTHDSLVPVALAAEFSRKVKTISNKPVVYLEVPRAQHAFDIFASPRSEHTKLGVARFLTHRYSIYLELMDA